ncbi:DUF2785 domain-containing protein [Henriciella marina]|uniref:DUF2785 domain-containing protein n=1 Tax=Henriciella marina TaxID=453851 RepID=UPI0003A867C9|nr:DUF2785 domain-containing protein [Henriciella marina]
MRTTSLRCKMLAVAGLFLLLALPSKSQDNTSAEDVYAGADDGKASTDETGPVLSSITAWLGRPKLKLPEDYPDKTRVLRGDIDPYDVFWEVPEHWATRAGMYAEYNTLEAYGRMREAALRDGVELVIISAFRSFDHQRAIWEGKWREHRKDARWSEPRELAIDIMRYSAMPGTSRHHWGTDIDLNALNNAWFDTVEGKRVYDWMKAHAAEYGFCEVYSARDGRREAGYEPERWHWSYIPTASRYLAAYVEAREAAPQGFEGDVAVSKIHWLTDYVLGINPDCLWKASDVGDGRPLPAPLLLAAMDAASSDTARRSDDMRKAGACIPEGWTRDALIRWKESEFPIENEKEVAGYLTMLEGCLGDPDPVLRDGVAYGGISHILRSDGAGKAELRALKELLLERLADEAGDPLGFSRPFAALALSEVARTDRMSPWMSNGERRTLLSAGASYVSGVRDYRGFVDGEGWRHGVAHGADLLMQLSLNEKIGKGEAQVIARAVYDAIGTHEAPAFIFDEPRRLARPLLFLTQRELLNERQLTGWMEALADPAPLTSWDEVFTSGEGLARRHNLRAFGAALLLSANAAQSGALDALQPGTMHLLRTVP